MIKCVDPAWTRVCKPSVRERFRQSLVMVADESWLGWDRVLWQEMHKTGELDPSQQDVPVRACAGESCWAKESGFSKWGRARARLEPGEMSGPLPDGQGRPWSPAGNRGQEPPLQAVTLLCTEPPSAHWA